MNKFTEKARFIRFVGSAFLVLFICVACENVGANPNAPELDNTSWVLTSLNGEPLVAGTEITIGFSDRTLTGSSGCNDYGSPYTATNTIFTAEGLNSSTKLCESPEGIMQQEQAYLDMFEQPLTYQREANRLTFNNGEIVLNFNLLTK